MLSIDDIRYTMLIRTPAELGAIIRDRRKQLKLDQAAFAKRIGVSRQWVIEIERGHPRAELGLVLRAIDVLDIHLNAGIDQTDHRRPTVGTVDIDDIVAKAKKAKP
jgi:HTH-type transcriptional regulator / antitoxin HipB